MSFDPLISTFLKSGKESEMLTLSGKTIDLLCVALAMTLSALTVKDFLRSSDRTSSLPCLEHADNPRITNPTRSKLSLFRWASIKSRSITAIDVRNGVVTDSLLAQSSVRGRPHHPLFSRTGISGGVGRSGVVSCHLAEMGGRDLYAALMDKVAGPRTCSIL